MGIWQSAFPILQRYIPAHRNNRFLRFLDKISQIYHLMFENVNYDCENNGELLLLKILNNSNNLNCVLDVGANIGDYSLIARRVNKKCRIIAFEPVPETFNLLKSNTHNLKIEIHNYALGNKLGKSLISVTNDSTLSTLLDYEQEYAGRNAEYIEVDVRTGEEFLLGEIDLKEISLLKIDTEGYEPEVLKGFRSHISNVNIIQFEYGKANLFSKYFLYDYFKDYARDFHIGKLYPKGVKFYQSYNWDLDDLLGPNIVMVNKNREDLLSLLSRY